MKHLTRDNLTDLEEFLERFIGAFGNITDEYAMRPIDIALTNIKFEIESIDEQ